jgi:hypothetical protein
MVPKFLACIKLEISHVLIDVSRVRISNGKLPELSLLYLDGKRKVIIIILVLNSIHLFISNLFLNEVIPQT